MLYIVLILSTHSKYKYCLSITNNRGFKFAKQNTLHSDRTLINNYNVLQCLWAVRSNTRTFLLTIKSRKPASTQTRHRVTGTRTRGYGNATRHQVRFSGNGITIKRGNNANAKNNNAIFYKTRSRNHD